MHEFDDYVRGTMLVGGTLLGTADSLPTKGVLGIWNGEDIQAIDSGDLTHQQDISRRRLSDYLAVSLGVIYVIRENPDEQDLAGLRAEGWPVTKLPKEHRDSRLYLRMVLKDGRVTDWVPVFTPEERRNAIERASGATH